MYWFAIALFRAGVLIWAYTSLLVVWPDYLLLVVTCEEGISL
jgi:hypothetical protein